MALEPEPLARAIGVVRRDDAGWSDVRADVLRRIGSLVPPGDPVLVLAAGVEPGRERTYLSSRVLRAALREVLTVSPTHTPAAIELVVADERLQGVDVELVVAMGVALPAVADRARASVRAELERLVGPEAPPSGLIGITIVDVVDGDPTRR
jgi:hypothetical protein